MANLHPAVYVRGKKVDLWPKTEVVFLTEKQMIEGVDADTKVRQDQFRHEVKLTIERLQDSLYGLNQAVRAAPILQKVATPYLLADIEIVELLRPGIKEQLEELEKHCKENKIKAIATNLPVLGVFNLDSAIALDGTKK